MSSENDVPLGEEGRRYYERQFGERIRQVSKSGGPPPPSGGSNWSGKAGAGVAIGAVFIVIRIILAVARTDSSVPSYTPPPVPKLDVDLDEVLRQVAEMKKRNEQLGLGLNLADPQLDDRDVPLLEGLCYRIHRQSQQPEATPGGRINQFLKARDQQLLVRAARGEALNEDERSELLDSLNGVLRRADFFDEDSFRTIALPVEPAQPLQEIQHFNRSLLEKCYPEQIVPLRERGHLDDQSREQWRKRARADLDKAKKEQVKR